jgi:hypothetical protein
VRKIDRKPPVAIALVAPAFLLTSFAAAAAPADHWTVENPVGKCRLERTFSSPVPAQFSLETGVGTDEYSLSVAEGKFGRLQVGLSEHATLRIDGRVRSRGFVTIFPADDSFSHLANFAGVPVDAVNAMSGGREFSIDGEAVKVGPLPLPEGAQGFAALRRCEAEQLIKWGADPAQFMAGGSRPQVGDRWTLIPQSELRRLRFPGPGEFLHYLQIDENGVVDRCASVSGATDAAFERELCGHVIGRKIGAPARDSTGNAVRGVVSFFPALTETTVTDTPLE